MPSRRAQLQLTEDRRDALRKRERERERCRSIAVGQVLFEKDEKMLLLLLLVLAGWLLLLLLLLLLLQVQSQPRRNVRRPRCSHARGLAVSSKAYLSLSKPYRATGYPDLHSARAPLSSSCWFTTVATTTNPPARSCACLLACLLTIKSWSCVAASLSHVIATINLFVVLLPTTS